MRERHEDDAYELQQERMNDLEYTNSIWDEEQEGKMPQNLTGTIYDVASDASNPFTLPSNTDWMTKRLVAAAHYSPAEYSFLKRSYMRGMPILEELGLPITKRQQVVAFAGRMKYRSRKKRLKRTNINRIKQYAKNIRVQVERRAAAKRKQRSAVISKKRMQNIIKNSNRKDEIEQKKFDLLEDWYTLHPHLRKYDKGHLLPKTAAELEEAANQIPYHDQDRHLLGKPHPINWNALTYLKRNQVFKKNSSSKRKGYPIIID